jgi:hypothetical protein
VQAGSVVAVTDEEQPVREGGVLTMIPAERFDEASSYASRWRCGLCFDLEE